MRCRGVNASFEKKLHTVVRGERSRKTVVVFHHGPARVPQMKRSTSCFLPHTPRILDACQSCAHETLLYSCGRSHDTERMKAVTPR